MQRFVVKRAEVSLTVKHSGYLKKRREKLRGWKKMWFVLQNQLLLSYGSKEEYEERLAPFKDVISLVPGTHIQPMPDNKFSIETTSKTMFLFRCDDAKQCSDWISILVESLNVCSDKPGILSKNTSDSHIPRPIFSEPLALESNTTNVPRLEADVMKLDRLSSMQQQHFRLHSESGRKYREHQSTDVTRINRMFNGPPAITVPASVTKTSESVAPLIHYFAPQSSSFFDTMKKFIVRKKKEADSRQNQAPEVSVRTIEEQIQNITIEEEEEGDLLEDENDNRETWWRNRDSYKNIQDLEDLDLGVLGPEPPESSSNTSEPVYAKVDKTMKKSTSSRPRDSHSPSPLKPSDDYEEIGIFVPAESTETIYEPIESASKTHRNFWQNFKQVNMETFVDLTRKIREKTSPGPESVVALREIRRKFGVSRSNLKEKVMKMYTRSETEGRTETDLSRRRKKASFFGSFGGKVKKNSRTSSMCFEEFVPAKKFTVSVGSNIPEEAIPAPVQTSTSPCEPERRNPSKELS